MISLRAEHGSITDIKADIIAVPVHEDRDLLQKSLQKVRAALGSASEQLESSSFAGKDGETLVLYPSQWKSRKLLLVGLGKAERDRAESHRRGAAVAAKSCENLKLRTLAFVQSAGGVDATAIASAIGEGVLLGAYKFDRYFTEVSRKERHLREAVVVVEQPHHPREASAALQRATVVCNAVSLARDLANAPPNEIFPESLARHAQTQGRKYGFKVTILDERKIRNLGMGGLLGVSEGSNKPPRFIIMEYRGGPRKSARPMVIIGKGVTFDAGGISIKPAAGMAEMRMDMSGAGAVIGTMQAAAALHVPVHLIGLIPATENLLGGGAMKPGDILRHLNGKTSEVDNTDAEGRLILADALSYAGTLKPAAVIDLATLTGACVVALGHVTSGMMGNNQKLMNMLKESGDRTYERVWQLPMFDEYENLIKSDVADVKNVGGRWAGAITAAMFLRRFVSDHPWAHLDIAGTAIMEEATDYIPKGASGVGVRLLTDFLQHWNATLEER